MLKNVYLLAKIGADTAEIELHFAEMLPIGHRSRRSAAQGAFPRGGAVPRREPRGHLRSVFFAETGADFDFVAGEAPEVNPLTGSARLANFCNCK